MSSVFEIVWILLLLLKISMASRDVSFENIQPGELTSSVIVEIGNHVPFLKPSLKWFSNNVKLFNFTTKDGLVLQGYFLDHRLSTGVDCANQRVIVHCAGFTESTLKYAQYLQRLYNLGYSIFSFDLRNQGFSASAGGYSRGSVAHMDSLSNTYVLDLEYFIIKHVHPCSKDIIFSGNSLSALIGLTLQQQNPIFEKIIVYSPCIAPNIPPALHLFIWLANWMGFGSTLAVRLGTDISTEKLTHDIQNLESWRDLRLLIPNYLILAGPTFRWLNELIIASANIIKVPFLIST
jgi:alpha-beta hydrolase superfamily lysophospholipase